MARAIMVYLRDTRIFIVPLARVRSGGHLETEPVIIHELPVPLEALEQSMMKSLQYSDQLLQDPPLSELKSPVLAASGIKTWRQFVKGTTACDVELIETGFIITPLRPERGPSYADEPEKSVEIPLQSPEGTAAGKLLEILQDSEAH